MLKRKSSLHITNIVSSKHMYVITERNMYCYQRYQGKSMDLVKHMYVITERNMYCYQRYQGQSMDLVKHTSQEFLSSFKYLIVYLQSFPSLFIIWISDIWIYCWIYKDIIFYSRMNLSYFVFFRIKIMNYYILLF